MNTKEIIKRIAQENNVTPEKVEEDMRNSIREAMASTDPHAQVLWKQIAPDGKEPSIETFLNFCVQRVKEQEGYNKWKNRY